MADRNPSDVFRRAVDWLGGHPGEPWFLYVHTFEAHSDYASLPRTEEIFTGPYRGRADGSTGQLIRLLNGRFSLDEAGLRHVIDLYAAGIRQADDELGRLIRFLEERGELDRTLLIVLADHGEEFLEHGGVLHGRTLFEELVRIPLIIRGPGARGGLRPAEPVSIVDVLPTVLGLLDLPAPPGLDGIDLRGAWRKGDSRALLGRSLFGESDPNDRNAVASRSVRSGRFKLVYDRREGRRALYDLAGDPGETADASGRYPAMAESLAAALTEYDSRNVPGVELPEVEEKVRERLRGLGYLD
jgi:arylsulfatase A-like enzyme